ncbi:MAG: hypothetical protein GY869_11275 [Planctomycetes bacterium]|nr:hypothetical protein [Planctomycetota bacterium]
MLWARNNSSATSFQPRPPRMPGEERLGSRVTCWWCWGTTGGSWSHGMLE